MSNILQQIVDARRGDIETLKVSLPLHTFKDKLVKSTRSLEKPYQRKIPALS